jgi:hypothetical protein
MTEASFRNHADEPRELLRAARCVLWLAGLVRLSKPEAAPHLSSKEIELTAISQEAA